MPFTDSGLDCEIRKNLRERLTKAAAPIFSSKRKRKLFCVALL